MKNTMIMVLALLMSMAASGQERMEGVLQEILRNNTGLQALTQHLEARRLENKTGIFLPDPEFSFSWFEGSPRELGDKTGLSLIQSFDFPTAYLYKSRLANGRNDQLPLEYEKYKADLLLEARLLLLELIHANAMAAEYDVRLGHARQMTAAYSRMLEVGQSNIMEYNKARLNLLNLQHEAQAIAIERESLHHRLAGLNGGKPVALEQTSFPQVPAMVDFETWVVQAQDRNPELQLISGQLALNQTRRKLQRALNLPALSAGYVSEMLTHEEFHGFTVGISIPLWENKNTLKQVKAQNLALEGALQDDALEYYSFLKAQYARAASLREAHREYQTLLASINSSELLEKAWKQGQIGITEYLVELSLYYQSVNNILEMELELHQTLARLYKYQEL